MSNERAEEVAKVVCNHSVYGCFPSETAKYLSSLPEFQPGRGLTADDVNEAFKRKYPVNNLLDWIDSCVFVAAELNKIRAPKADDVRLIKGYTPIEWDGLKKCCSDWEKQSNSQMDMRQKAEKERDELKSMNEKLRVDIRCADDAKAALQTAYNELKAHPVGVTKEQVKAAFKSLEWTGYDTDDCRQKLAAALSPKWLKCSERMPEKGQSCFLYCESGSLISDTYDAGFFTTLTHWQPRYVPAPPVEEESIELQELREHVQSWNLVMAKKVIDAFIAYEKGTK